MVLSGGMESPKDPWPNVEILLSQIEQNVRPPTMLQRVLQGAALGFGTFLGATLVVALAVAVLRPFTHLAGIGERVDRLIRVLESPRPQNPPR